VFLHGTICATVLQRATRTKAAAAARSDGAICSSIRSLLRCRQLGVGATSAGRRCSKTDNNNVKICADSKGTACPLDKCRDKCVAHTDFACAWYAHDPAKNDCYLYETCKNEAADADYTQYLLAAAPAAVAGATLSRFIWPPPICLLYVCFKRSHALTPHPTVGSELHVLLRLSACLRLGRVG
jgi:hypothetical protein